MSTHTITRTEGYTERFADMDSFVVEHQSSSVASRDNADAIVRSLVGEGFQLTPMTGGDARLEKPGVVLTYHVSSYFDTSDWL